MLLLGYVNATALANNNSSNGGLVAAERSWGSRRMNKQAKYDRFETQQQLELEIRAKQQALEELRVTRMRCDEAEKELFDARRRVGFMTNAFCQKLSVISAMEIMKNIY